MIDSTGSCVTCMRRYEEKIRKLQDRVGDLENDKQNLRRIISDRLCINTSEEKTDKTTDSITGKDAMYQGLYIQ